MYFSYSLKNPFSNDEYYFVREDGLVYTFDYKTFKWCKITSEGRDLDGFTNFTNSQKFDHDMVDNYEKMSLSYHKEELKYFEKHPSFKWGEAIYYYKKNGQIRGKDENGFEYEGKIPYLLVSEEKLIDDSWTRINRLDTLFEIGNFREYVKVYYMDTYLDEEGVLHAFTKDGREYRVSKRNGNMNEILDTKGVLPSYKPVNEKIYSYYLYEPYYHYSKTFLELQSMRELDRYLYDNKKELLKQNIELGSDIWFYDKGWHDIYMVDSNENEYHVLPSSLEVLEKGTINQEKWNEVDYLLALDYAKLHDERQKQIENGAPLLPIDLELYKTYDGLYFGKAEDKKTYYLDKDGTFKLLSKEDKDKWVKSDSWYEVDYDDYDKAIMEQCGIKSIHYFYNFIRKGLKDNGVKLYFREDSRLVEKFTLYLSSEDLSEAKIFIEDYKGNEYECTASSIEKREKGTIKDEWKELDIEDFRLYYKNLYSLKPRNN